MKVLGLILEANPFHNGHDYFIKEAISKVKPDLCIGITTTSFNMRGEISLLDKFTKIKILLNHHIDLIFELPMVLATHSADIFAEQNIKILQKLGVTDLAFGCEIDDLDKILNLTSVLSSSSFIDNYRQNKKMNLSQKEAYIDSIKNLISESDLYIFNQPNVTLGISYIKACEKNNFSPQFHIIHRIEAKHHDLELNTNQFITSGKSIRNGIRNHLTIDNYLPKDVINHLININKTEENYLNIIRYKYTVDQHINNIWQCRDGINNYIKDNADFTSTLTKYQDSLKNKRYSINRINRQTLLTLLSIDDIDFNCIYLRLLGSNEKGFNYINILKKEIKNLIFANPNETTNHSISIKSILQKEIETTKLYGILVNQPLLYLEEYRLPIRKDEHES